MRHAVDGIPASRLLCMKCFSAAPSRVRSTNEECPVVREKDENRTGTKVPDGSEVAGPLIPVVDAERENLQLDDHSLPTDSAAQRSSCKLDFFHCVLAVAGGRIGTAALPPEL